MNEIFFLIQLFTVIFFTLGAMRLGKNALISGIAIQAILANLFVIKQVTLFGYQVTASDVFAIGSLLGLNLVQEYFGKEEAKKATWICFFYMFFFVAVSHIHLLYIPNSYDVSQDAFTTILAQTPRLLLASLSVFFVVQQIDLKFFSFIKNRSPKLSFVTRSYISLVFSQFLDTVLFSFVGLYGLVGSIGDVIYVSFLIKIIAISLMTPFVRWAKVKALPT